MKLFLFLISVLIFTGCGKQKDCIDAPLILNFINYSREDVDTLKIYVYTKGSSFSNILDSAFAPINNSIVTNFRNNIQIMPLLPRRQYVISDYDWMVYLASTRESFFISEILVEKQTKKCSGFLSFNCSGCNHTYASYKLNNSTITVNQDSTMITIRR